MFGDNYMAFRQFASIDDKSRIMLPKQTGAEEGELLYLICDAYNDHLVISKAKNLIAKIERLQSECLKTNDKATYEKLSKEKDYYSSLILQVLIVDKQKRVSLGKRIQEKLNTGEIFISGQANEVHIFRSENQYQELYGHTI